MELSTRKKLIDNLQSFQDIDPDNDIKEIIEEQSLLLKQNIPENIPEELILNEPTPDLMPQGFLSLGRSFIYNTNVTIAEPRHLFIGGQNRTGKTLTNIYLIFQLLGQGFKVWVHDLKNDYLGLIKYIPNLIIIHWEEMKENPLWLADNINPIQWLFKFSDLFAYLSQFGMRSRNYFRKQLIKLFSNYDKNYPPCFLDLHDFLLKSKPKGGFGDYEHIQVWRRVKDKVENISLVLENQLKYSKGFPIQYLQNHNIVFNYSGLSPDIYSLLINNYSYKNFWYRFYTREA